MSSRRGVVMGRMMTAGVAAGGLALGLLSGCSSNALDRKASEIRANPSPELKTLYQRESDIDNRLTLTIDENLRMVKQDLGRVFLLERPSRLTWEPVPR